MSSFLGMRSTNDFVTDQRPKNWREAILHLWPTGQAPLTAITALMASERTDDPQFFWWTKKLPTQRATVTGVYTDSGLTTSYSGGGTADNTTVYFKMNADDTQHFTKQMSVMARTSSNLDADLVLEVTDVVTNGDDSYVEAIMLEDDVNDASGTDALLVIANINEEGAETPDALSYDPVKFFNYTGIIRTPLYLTRTAQRTRLRTGDQYKEAKRECLELHSIALERAFLLSIPTERTGASGRPKRTSASVLYFARKYVPNNVSDFTKIYSGNTWLSRGDDFIDEALELWYRYGTDPLALCGSGALLGLQKLAKNSGTLQIMPESDIGYGFKVHGLATSFGDIPLRTHPLMSQEPTLRNTIIIIQPRHMRYRYIDDTTFYGQKDDLGFSSGGKRVDARVEEFLTEAGLEYQHPDTIMVLNNVGIDG